MGFLGDALDFVDDAVDSGTKFVAKGLQKGGHLAGEALDAAGLHGAGQTVSGWGDDIADDAGVKVKERNLDQSDDPKELLHGDAKKLNEVAGHLQKFHDAFDKAGQGLTRLDTDHWTGEAADNFRRDFDPQPKQWLAAADAFAKAGIALTTYAHTVSWAQDQAKDAVRIWKEAQKKTDAAAKTYMNDAMTYNLRLKAYNATPADQRQGDPPADPGEFKPPADAVAQFKEAEDKLDAARTQRDSAARTALAAVKALVESAPAMPSRTEILKAEVMDTATSVPELVLHFGGGVVKSAVDLNKLLRSVNPIDPYNATHPAEYATGLSGLLAGLSGSANNPVEAVKGLVGSGWGSDPAEAGGKLFGNLLLAPETGGGSAAATAAEREATAVAENAAKNTAEQAAKDAAEKAAEQGGAADWYKDIFEPKGPWRPETQTTYPAYHAGSVTPEQAQALIDSEFPWLKDLNSPRFEAGQPGYNVNCTNNVVAVDRRLDGLDVYTAPLQKGRTDPEMEDLYRKELGDPEASFHPVRGYDVISEDMSARGPGSRGVVSIDRGDYTGHVFNVVNVDGRVIYIDGQTGRLATLETDDITSIKYMPYR
ncbi:putative T7SS-secreted protein [Kitasatospora sp. NPDC059648]|uniref:putative T7SS-secreted protein n=1 Tax=Kitasatospora sp. NPDC059648 TaxID=3346894 RepID=UPI0036A7B493